MPHEDDLNEEDLPESNSPIYRHAARSKDFELAFGDGSAVEAISAHIEKYLGPIEMVYHEILSDLVHVDVHHVAPRPGRNYHTLITSGMSDRPMVVPPGAEEFRFAEVLLCLPPTWKLSDEAFRDEHNYWPVRLLKMLARFPHEYDTWLGWGHTLPNQNPMTPYTDQTKLCCALLLRPRKAARDFCQLSVSPEKTIHFLAVTPVYAEEMDFKLKRGTKALCDLFENNGVTELVDIRRKNVCKRSLWPF